MEDEEENTTPDRPLGYWLRAVDALIDRELQAALAAEDVTRRDWMLLNALSGAVDVPGLAERLARRGKRLRGLVDRGWIAEEDGRWALTDEGRAARERLAALVQGVRDKVAGAVPADQFSAMTASLQAIARELGGDESARMPWPGARRGFGRGERPGPRPFGFGPAFDPRFGAEGGHGRWPEGGPGHGPGFGPASDAGFGLGRGRGRRIGGDPRAFEHGEGHPFSAAHAHRWYGHDGHGLDPHGGAGFRHGFGHGFGAPGECAHDHPHGHGRGHGHGARHRAERAYERGFEAGFKAARRPDDGHESASGSAA